MSFKPAVEMRKLGNFCNRWFGCQIVTGHFLQMWLGRLHFHLFFKKDPGTALHNHPWSFTTFPLRTYVEEIYNEDSQALDRQLVYGWRRNRRPSSHTHRYLGRWSGKDFKTTPGWVPTFVWVGKQERPAFSFFMFDKDGKWSAYEWKSFIKHTVKGLR